MFTAFDPEYEASIIHIAALSINSDNKLHLSKKVQIAYLKADKALIKVPCNYADFADIFSPKLVAELLKNTQINDLTIKLIDDLQLFYGLIYSLGVIELEILKTYIKNNLAKGFIRPSKSLVKAPIFFDKKPDGNLRLYINY